MGAANLASRLLALGASLLPLAVLGLCLAFALTLGERSGARPRIERLGLACGLYLLGAALLGCLWVVWLGLRFALSG